MARKTVKETIVNGIPKLSIKEPIWKNKSVGINESYCKHYQILVEVLYKNIDKMRVFPDIYIVRGDKVKLYPKQIVKGNILHIVPLSEMDIYGG